MRSTAAIQAVQVCRVHSARSVMSGWSAVDLGQHDAMGGASARLDRCRGVPAFDCLHPARGGAGDGDGPVPISRCRWRGGVSERGQSPVNAVQVAAV